MNPARALLHLFSPLGGEGADNYRAPGQISFLRAPFVPADSDELVASDAKYAFIGVPFDEGNVGKPGCEDGPREFRVASLDYFPYWFEFNVDLHGTALDCGDVQMPRVNPEVARERIYAAVRAVLAAGKTPIICGGDRSISIPAAKALSEQGVKGIYCCVTHPVLSRNAAEIMAHSKFKEVVVADTIPMSPEKQNGKFTVLSVAPLLGEAIYRIHKGQSVGDLFK